MWHKHEIREHKAALLALLAANDASPLAVVPAAGADPVPLPGPKQAADRAAIAAHPPPAATVPVEAETLAAWEAELAGLLAAAPGQRITDPDKAALYFASEARRRLACVRHDRYAAGLLMGFGRHARGMGHLVQMERINNA
jgi:hypothetical protein